MCTRWPPLAPWILALAACSACSTEAKLREAGATSYVRCIAAPDAADRDGQLGDVRFQLRARELILRPSKLPLRIGAFSGAGFGAAPTAHELALLRDSGAELFLLLGGLGDREALAKTVLERVVGLGRPVLLLLGGRDTWGISRKAVDALADSSGIIDATILRRIRVGNNSLVPVAGADQGRYVSSPDGCGFGQTDLDTAAQQLGTKSPSERRWLVSWQAAAGWEGLPGAAQSDTGLDLGSYELSRFGRRIGADGALSAWPAGRADRLAPGPLVARVVPRAFGPRSERPDGGRAAPGVLLLELDDQGLRVVR